MTDAAAVREAGLAAERGFKSLKKQHGAQDALSYYGLGCAGLKQAARSAQGWQRERNNLYLLREAINDAMAQWLPRVSDD